MTRSLTRNVISMMTVELLRNYSVISLISFFFLSKYTGTFSERIVQLISFYEYEQHECWSQHKVVLLKENGDLTLNCLVLNGKLNVQFSIDQQVLVYEKEKRIFSFLLCYSATLSTHRLCWWRHQKLFHFFIQIFIFFNCEELEGEKDPAKGIFEDTWSYNFFFFRIYLLISMEIIINISIDLIVPFL